MSVSLLLACAGKGQRAGLSQNKLLYKVNGKTILENTLSKFYSSGVINQYVVIVSSADYDYVKSILPSEVELVIGGNTRTQSVKNGLQKVTGDIVLIHDGARPFVSKRVILDCIETVKQRQAQFPLSPLPTPLAKLVTVKF